MLGLDVHYGALGVVGQLQAAAEGDSWIRSFLF